MMGSEVGVIGDTPSMVRDLIALTKVRITLLEVTMMAGGLFLAGGSPHWSVVIAGFVGCALVVAAANAWNMVLERDTDKLMARTRERPLPAERMPVWVAAAFGTALLVASMVVLWWWVNPLTTGLGLLGFVSYVCVYTPLKRRSTHALLIGAVPGAIPAVMGWTAATGGLSTPGLIFAGILFFWQLPHFLAIALFRKRDYERAEMKVVPVVRGERIAQIQALAFTVALVVTSLMLVPYGGAGWLYFVVALGLGLWFLRLVLESFWKGAGPVWARRIFMASLVYLPVLTLGLLVDVAMR